MSGYTEVEQPFLQQLQALDWDIIDQGQEIPSDPTRSRRANFRQWLLPEVFNQAVAALNLGLSGSEQVTPEVTPEVLGMLAVIQGDMSRAEIMAALGLKDEKHFREHYQQAGIASGVIAMTLPDKPRSSKQRYRLTALGERCLRALRDGARE